jgi:YD repeat-containing protein
MLTIVDPRGYTEVSNTYDPASGRIVAQTLADSTSTYQMAYTLNRSGQITETAITDPNGNIELKGFDSNVFVTSNIFAGGSLVQQSYNYTRSSTELITAMTDRLGRQFSYGYDSNSNLTSITCSNCVSASITSSMTYDPTFNQLTSITVQPAPLCPSGRFLR